MSDLMNLISNANAADVRYETLEGRKHVVVPIVMMTEGVHKGSGGSILYKNQEMAAAPTIWDHKPIVVYHPEINGKGTSACDPTILNTQKIGIMLHTQYADKLKCEGWIDIERANAVDKRVMTAIDTKKMMEVSTGVFVDVTKEEGEWQGEKYVGTAGNLRADHLAILPDQIGACSIADGAGLLRNAAQDQPNVARLNAQLGPIINARVTAGTLILNELSFSNISNALTLSLRDRLGKTWMGWIEDVYPDFIVYAKDDKLFRLKYTIDGEKVTLGNEPPEEVVRVTEYRTVSGTFVGNSEKGNITMTKVERVNALITNGGFKEDDRAYLMLQTEQDLGRFPTTLVKNNEPTAEEKAAADKKAADEAEAAKAGTATVPNAGTAPVANKASTVAEFIANAPPQIGRLLTNALNHEAAERSKLAKIVLNSKGNVFSEAYLNDPGRSIDELQGMAALAQAAQPEPAPQTYGYQPPPTLNYTGAGAGGVPVTNSAVTETPLPRPGNMFAKKTA